MRYIFIIYHLLLLLTSGCGKQKYHAVEQVKRKMTPLLCQFTATVEGVECAHCAHDIETVFNSFDGVSMADFITQGAAYEGGHFSFCYDLCKANIDLNSLTSRISEEGFVLQKLSGCFKVKLCEQNNRWFVYYSEDALLPLRIKNDPELKRALIKQHNQMLFAHGSIVLQVDKSFIFMLDAIGSKYYI